ncbi:AlpA family transcriptional regulator [Pseudomonas sp. NFACC45]|uniref:AlpA family transcriptional regulator n=1 Tax=Pseudomonas sp. NFACC45 TaxID=1566201 RepID=UPI0008E7CF0F|nr:AlpA family transcriptional regulator [Pseudomonas sp. NFACC45]SFH38399.1 transcriptional regulator, AlpA family [Pseudomonas sp. NFACC45]
MPTHIDSQPPLHERRILRLSDVEQKTGLKRSFLYSLMNLGKFPKSVRLGVRAVGWDAEEVDQWIADRLSDRG